MIGRSMPRGRLSIERADQVRCAEIAQIPMRRGLLYLVAAMDWASRKVLSWRIPDPGPENGKAGGVTLKPGFGLARPPSCPKEWAHLV
jgi:hypothetical protein